MEDPTTARETGDCGENVEAGRADGVGRRRFLERLAGSAAVTTAATAGIAVPGRASDNGRRRQSGRRGASGVDRRTETRLERAIRRGDHRDGVRLLDGSDVVGGATRTAMPAVGTGRDGRRATGETHGAASGSGGVSTQDVYARDDSSFWLYVWHRGGDVYRAYASWELSLSATSWIDGAGPDDGVGITVSEDHWEPVIGSWSFGDRTELDERGALGVIGRFDDAQPGCNGISCGDPSRSARTGWQRVDLRKKESGSHNVYGSYVHTWNPWRVPGWVEFTLSVGPISAKTSGNVDSWTRRSDMNL